MDLQTPCNACTLINRKPASPKLSFSRNNVSMRKYRCKTVSELQSTASVNGGASPSPVPSHKITVHDRQRDVVHEFYVPEDQYILHTAEDQDIKLPFACRHGIGYALLCVGFPSSDLEVETQDEDEVYWLQFGRYFARGPIERDDYALELAMADE
ncbi:ferredoxin C 2, chloroplastic [Salvia hispanica]|uniref:ferredoxin C 2, chloroplastic n=1 Tax=Salvia hispanica TaxID=49212 RepID=UPI002009124F|nr:ferredoxin C 2, chloroplastic [Salvia hispanica]